MKSGRLIECRDHKFAPWSIVCRHLVTGRSREWIRVEGSGEPDDLTDEDWVCPECFEKHFGQPHDEPSEDDLKDLQAICMHCVRKLRKRYDPNYRENDTPDTTGEQDMMKTLYSPDLPPGDLYAILVRMKGEPEADKALGALDKTFDENKIPPKLRPEMGNTVIRYACLVLRNGSFPIDQGDVRWVNLDDLGKKFLKYLGEQPKLLDIVGGKKE